MPFSLWGVISYVFNSEIFVCVLLMAISYLPKFIRRPMKDFMKRLNSPLFGHFTIFMIIVLTVCFAESIRKASKYRHYDGHDGTKEKYMHDAKRLRAERNSYIAFGSLFLALEEAEEKEASKHEALKKQVQNRENQAGLVDVAKGLSEVAKSGRVELTPADYEKKIAALETEIAALRASRGSDTDLKEKEAATAADLKKRVPSKTDKDD